MRFQDLLWMSSSNLWKRKIRTILTVLGVVIGVASIVVMVSLGLGLSRSLVSQYESYGGLTQITVNAPYQVEPNNQEVKYLNDALIAQINSFENVESVIPVMEMGILAKCGGYENYLQIMAVPAEHFDHFGITLESGEFPKSGEPLSFVYGCEVLQNFYHAKTGQGFWQTGEMPSIDLMKDPVFTIFNTDAYYQSQGNTEGQNVRPPKKYLIPAAGIEKKPESGYSRYGWYTFCDLEQFVTILKKEYKNSVIPGQPSTKSGKPYKEIFYNTLYVNVSDMDAVNAVQTAIKDLGYEAYSNAEWLESEQKTMGYIQAVLGGIGAVSLLVAAIGITNTMMMSIYERTKEIGVMKVLGCSLPNVRLLFLMEAGFIGLIGGAIGLLLSYLISFVINKVVAGFSEYMTGISYIPFWLALAAMIFAVLVGMIAGFFPARRAMKLSPLAAIRNE